MKTFNDIVIGDKIFQLHPNTGTLITHTVSNILFSKNCIKIITNKNLIFYVDDTEYYELPDETTLYASPFCVWSEMKRLIIHYNNIVEQLELNRGPIKNLLIMKYFKKINQFINLCNIVIKRYDNDLTDSDKTVHSRYIKLFDILNNSSILLYNKKANKAINNTSNAFHKWHRRGSNLALNKYIIASIRYIEKQSKLSDRLNAYNELFRDHKAGFYHDSDKKIIDIVTNKQLMRLIFAIVLK